MPIRWSAVKVSEKAEELKQIPNLPGYIDQPTNTMFWKVANFNDYMKGFSQRIREHIPQDALGEERKALEYDSQQSLI